MVVQSVLIPKTFTIEYAKNWLKEHKYKYNKIDVTDKFYRFRQTEPNPSKRYYTKVLDNGVELIIMS